MSVPLFSLYSKQSAGIGELPDLKLLIDWCNRTRMSIIQLLPLNDTGFNFRPYDAQSTFALDPMYLCLDELTGVPNRSFRDAVQILRKNFPIGARVNYEIKKAKLDLLWKIFQADPPSSRFEAFIQQNRFWLEDYALFKVIKELQKEKPWESWESPLRDREASALQKITEENKPRILFHQWLQWQLCEQFRDVKRYAAEKKVFLMGDLPFLVSRDSAEVWAHRDYFKMDLAAGAPPDAFFAAGQRWGMPPYHWPVIEQHGFDYLIEKIKYAQHFYDMFRIDHVVGAFRLWTIPLSEPAESGGSNGRFDPANEQEWDAHGRKLLSVMAQNTEMLPCAEDLGVVPESSYRTLWDFAIPGMEVQRWTKEWHTDCGFKAPEKYRPNAAAVLSNHDMTSFHGWWEFEAGTVDEALVKRKCGEKGLDFESLKPQLFDGDPSRPGRLRWRTEIKDIGTLLQKLGRPHDQAADLVEIYRGSYGEKIKFWQYAGLEGEPEEKPSPRLLKAALEKASVSSAIFSVQLLQDLLDLGPAFAHDAWEFRINFPGTTSEKNWALVIPLSLEEMNRSKINGVIKKIHELGDRV